MNTITSIVGMIDLKPYMVTNDNVLLHFVALALALLFVTAVVWIIMLKSRIRFLKKNNAVLEQQKVELIAENGRLEDELEKHKYQTSDLGKQIEIQSNQVVNHKFTTDKLNSRIEALQGELLKKEEQLQEAVRKTQQSLPPDAQRRLDELELRLVKLEKIKRLNNIEILSEDEYLRAKNQLLNDLLQN